MPHNTNLPLYAQFGIPNSVSCQAFGNASLWCAVGTHPVCEKMCKVSCAALTYQQDSGILLIGALFIILT